MTLYNARRAFGKFCNENWGREAVNREVYEEDGEMFARCDFTPGGEEATFRVTHSASEFSFEQVG